MFSFSHFECPEKYDCSGFWLHLEFLQFPVKERLPSEVERLCHEVERLLPEVERLCPDVERLHSDVELVHPEVERLCLKVERCRYFSFIEMLISRVFTRLYLLFIL